MIIEVVDCLGFRLIAFLSFPVPLFSYFLFDKVVTFLTAKVQSRPGWHLTVTVRTFRTVPYCKRENDIDRDVTEYDETFLAGPSGWFGFT